MIHGTGTTVRTNGQLSLNSLKENDKQWLLIQILDITPFLILMRSSKLEIVVSSELMHRAKNTY